jgi:cytochrome c6
MRSMKQMRIVLALLLVSLSLVLVGCPADEPAPTGATPPPVETPDETPVPDETPDVNDEPDVDEAELIEIGETVYINQCAACHQEDGQGIPGTYPALAGDPLVLQDDPAQAIQVVLGGRGAMPAFGNQLNDEEVAGVVSYIRTSWGNDASVVTPDEVAEQR